MDVEACNIQFFNSLPKLYNLAMNKTIQLHVQKNHTKNDATFYWKANNINVYDKICLGCIIYMSRISLGSPNLLWNLFITNSIIISSLKLDFNVNFMMHFSFVKFPFLLYVYFEKSWKCKNVVIQRRQMRLKKIVRSCIKTIQTFSILWYGY